MFEDIVSESPTKSGPGPYKEEAKKQVPTPVLNGGGSSSPQQSPTPNLDKVILYSNIGTEFIRITQIDDVYAYGKLELNRDIILDAFHDWLVDKGY